MKRGDLVTDGLLTGTYLGHTFRAEGELRTMVRLSKTGFAIDLPLGSLSVVGEGARPSPREPALVHAMSDVELWGE